MRTADPPIRTDRDLTPPSAPIEIDPRQLLAEPSADDVIAARAAAGQTQRQASATIGASRWQTWSDYESGRKPMTALAWTWYLLATGQHPHAKVVRSNR